MGVQNAAIAIGASSVAATGGTSTTFTPDGNNPAKGVHLIDAADTNALTRKEILVYNRASSLQPDQSFSKAIRKVHFKVPKVLASGKLSYSWVRAEVEYHPEVTDAEITSMVMSGAQLFGDSDFLSFWKTGNMA